MNYATNRKARYDYEILEKVEAGLVLTGFETKAVKAGKASINSAYVKIFGNELWLIGSTIAPFQPNNTPKDYDQIRTRKLLVRKEQLKKMIGKTEIKGISLIPLNLYSKNNLIKVEIAVARGKKKYDKREIIKKREFNIEKRRILKNRT